MERDIQLDCYRSLTMIYIVCVIHILYLFEINNETIKSLALFEMPMIFFIAGASQSYKNKYTFHQVLSSRIKRTIVPYYIFIFFLFIFLYICTLLGTTFLGQTINIIELSSGDIIKVLFTGGCKKIPYFGYTWFILCYLIISCSLPLQKKLIEKMPAYMYVFIMLAAFALCCILKIKTPKETLERVLCYNFFYILGFLYYKKLSYKKILFIAILPSIISVYLVLSGKVYPMQEHKFPPDMIFLTYCLSVLCILGLIFSKIKIKYNYIIKIWNIKGYSIYLYQTISFFIVYKITENQIENINNGFLLFLIYLIPIFITTTTLSYITFWIEKRVYYMLEIFIPYFKKRIITHK